MLRKGLSPKCKIKRAVLSFQKKICLVKIGSLMEIRFGGKDISKGK
jgi:hypothetical protein